MRQFKLLPLLPIHPPNLSSTDCLWGFGLDPSSGDYKVVFIQFLRNEVMDVPRNALVSVCNSSSDSWRHFEDVDLLKYHGGNTPMINTYLNGTYYWQIQIISVGRFEIDILAFDMSGEKFQIVQPPDISKPGCLTLYGDSLAYLNVDIKNSDMCIVVWVMTNERRWIKCQTVGPFRGISWPLCIWKNDELLIDTCTSLLVFCNLSTRKYRTIEYKMTGIGLRKTAVLYKESLVSIKGERNKCMMLWDTSSKFVKDILQC